MLRKLLRAEIKSLSEEEFALVLDLAKDDIRVNRLLTKKRTSIKYLVYVAKTSIEALQRGIKKTA